MGVCGFAVGLSLVSLIELGKTPIATMFGGRRRGCSA